MNLNLLKALGTLARLSTFSPPTGHFSRRVPSSEVKFSYSRSRYLIRADQFAPAPPLDPL
ncbi:hypothetical protein P5673_000658 [Acropora cervicornis]|uniref:Uncharacterized protein n=1 Tax=Acropora cervicornis TaxID=6130 RepID=A0AAD9R7H4_ACRCE|nr:hypothetical protein P5673_000658 [Acropora cervicornis]